MRPKSADPSSTPAPLTRTRWLGTIAAFPMALAMLLAACSANPETVVSTQSAPPIAATTTSPETTVTVAIEDTLAAPPETTSDDTVVYDPDSLGSLGDCFDQTTDSYLTQPCDQPHDFQIVLADGQYEAPADAAYPSAEEWAAWQKTFCVPALQTFTNGSHDPETVDALAIGPTETAWTDELDRAVWCAAYSTATDNLELSLEATS